MFLQFFTARQFHIPASKVLKIVRGAQKVKGIQGSAKTPSSDTVVIGNKGVVEMEKGEALKMLDRYSTECEAWGEDALKVKPVKGKKGKITGSERDIA